MPKISLSWQRTIAMSKNLTLDSSLRFYPPLLHVVSLPLSFPLPLWPFRPPLSLLAPPSPYPWMLWRCPGQPWGLWPPPCQCGWGGWPAERTRAWSCKYDVQVQVQARDHNDELLYVNSEMKMHLMQKCCF